MALGVNGIAQGAGNGASLSTATPQPLGTADAGASGEAADAAHVHPMPDATDVGAAALVAALSGRALTMRPDVGTVLDFTSLDGGDNPLAVMVYDPIAKTLTAGVDVDVTGFGLTPGMSLLIRFQQTSKPTSGVYTLTDPGSASTPAVFTRRADFDASGDFATGLAVRDAGEGGLYRVQVPDGFTLDTHDNVWTKVRAVLLSEGAPLGAAEVSDGSGDTRTTSAGVSRALAAVDEAAARAALHPAVLVTSANATVTDASPAGDGAAAVDGDGLITLSTDPALPGGFAAGPKVALALSGDAGSRFRARVRLVSTAGPSSDSLLALYFKNATGMGVYARISGQIGVWDLGGGVPATASVTALWDGTEYLEVRSFDGLIHFGLWQGTTWVPIYTTSRNDAAATVGVVLGSVSAASTQTVTLDGFRVTDLRAW